MIFLVSESKHMDQQEILKNTIERCRERHIILPTYKQMRHPDLIPESIKEKLKNIGLWDLNSLNLFRINWKNEPVHFGGGFGGGTTVRKYGLVQVTFIPYGQAVIE